MTSSSQMGSLEKAVQFEFAAADALQDRATDLFGEVRFPALGLWQPYAALPLYDAKPWETRGRPYPAKYHGQRILIASTKAFTPRALFSDALHELCLSAFGCNYESTLQRGFALYTIILKGCERTEDMVHRVPPELLASGDFSPGRWAWTWGDVEPLNPFPVRSGQGWWFCHVPNSAWRCATTPPVQQALSRRNGGDSRLCSELKNPPLPGAKGG